MIISGIPQLYSSNEGTAFLKLNEEQRQKLEAKKKMYK
jgi:hypothetical protein